MIVVSPWFQFSEPASLAALHGLAEEGSGENQAFEWEIFTIELTIEGNGLKVHFCKWFGMNVTCAWLSSMLLFWYRHMALAFLKSAC